MEGSNDGAPAARGVEGMARQFVRVETISMHALVVRLADKFAAIFHHQPIIHARVIIRWQREIVVIQLGHQLIAEVFFVISVLC